MRRQQQHSSGSGIGSHSEATYDSSGTRYEPVWSVLHDRPAADIPLDRDDVLLVTGGGKGITAECALALARETGVRLALVGRARPDEDISLRENLSRMQSESVSLLYVPADVTDEESIARAIKNIQAELGPVSGRFHVSTHEG